MRPRLADNIFNRKHSLQPPGLGDETPIVITENPSRDFYFPVSIEEVTLALKKLPDDHVDGITHIWFRKLRKSDWEGRRHPLAQYICGSGVAVVVLYPWPRDRRLWLGEKKPKGRRFSWFKKWGPDVVKEKDGWWLSWTEEALRLFYIEGLLLHEVGHHVDFYRRRWSSANVGATEEFADQYAVEWAGIDSVTWIHEDGSDDGS